MTAANINRERFNALRQEERPLLVAYSAPWCGYCRRLEPIYDRVAEIWSETMEVTKVDIDREPAMARRERIEVIPTLVLYRQGTALGSIVAPESREMIEEFIRQTLEK